VRRKVEALLQQQARARGQQQQLLLHAAQQAAQAAAAEAAVRQSQLAMQQTALAGLKQQLSQHCQLLQTVACEWRVGGRGAACGSVVVSS
jgi:hypothetical protein